MKMSNFKRVTSKSLAAIIAAVTVITFQPSSLIMEACAQSGTEYSFDSGSFAFHAGKGGLLLNEKSVSVNGSIFSSGDFSYTGSQENLYVGGNLLTGGSGAECIMPDYTKALNENAEYDFTFEGDRDIKSSVIDLSSDSFYAGGSVNVLHSSLTGEGNITAKEDITMELYGEPDDSQQSVIMSETGDITVNAADLSFNGVMYAPNGKVEINAKHINFTGAVYAEKIEINGTTLQMQYKDFLPDVLLCRAANEEVVRVQQGKELKLNGFCNHDDANVRYTAEPGQEQYVKIENADTLDPSLVFSEPGEYVITLTAEHDGETVSDTVKVVVTFGALVNYTSSSDFESGEISKLNGENDELKLSGENAESEPIVRNYNAGGESGISVESRQSSSAVISSGDTFDIGYTLSGYGKTDSGNGSDVILAIDNSGSVSSMVPTIKETTTAILGFMGPNDRFGITSLDSINTVLTDSKKALTSAIDTYSLTGGSNYGLGLSLAMSMFDEKSVDRNKYIILIADGENDGSDDAVAIENAKAAAEQGVKIYSFEINPFSNDFANTQTMQQIAIDTNGAYKLCPDAEAVSEFMLRMADTIYNLAARNVTFKTTVMNGEWLDTLSMENAPDSVVNNEDGSVTMSWKFNTFEIGMIDEIDLSLKTEMLKNSGYEQITSDTELIYYNGDGEGTVVYLDDIILEKNNFADSGSWSSKIFDSKKENCTWSLVKWNANYKGNSAINVFLSTSNDGVSFSRPIQVSNGQELNLSGRYIRTFVEMTASDDGGTPTLYDLTIYSDSDVKAEKPDEGNTVMICGAKTVEANHPLNLWLDIDGNWDNIDKLEWSVTGDGETESEENGQLRRRITFAEEGEYSVTVSVTAGGIKSEAFVNISVLPEKKLSQSDTGTEYKPIKMTVSETPDYVTTNDPVTFKISFEAPEQVSWMRVLYSNEAAWGNNVYQAFVDEANENTVSVALPYNNLSDSKITVQAFDWYGNMVEELRNIRMDRVAPVVNISADKTSFYPGDQAVIIVSATDNDEIASAVLKCGEDELTVDENGQSVFSPTEPGSYVVSYTAADKAGLESTKVVTINVREDNVQPNISIQGTNRIVLGNSTDLKITASDVQTGLASWILKYEDGTELISFSSENGEVPAEYVYTFAPDAVGSYVLVAEATDNAGNVRSVSTTINCIADERGPAITLELSEEEILAGDQITASVSAVDEVSVNEIHFFVNGEEQQLSEDGTYVYTSDDTNIDETGYKLVEFSAVASDNSGNESTASKKLKVSAADTTAPDIKITGSDIFEYNSENAGMTVNVTDNIGVKNIEVYVNNELVTLDENNSYYFDTSKLCEYEVRVTAEDSSGNPASADKIVTIADRTKPTISIAKDKSSYNMGDTAVFEVTVNDNYAVQTVEASWDGNAIQTDNGSFEYTAANLEAGTHELYVKAVDTSGNEIETKYPITAKDTEAPVVELASAKEKYAKGEKPDISCIITDNVGVAKVEADINGTAIEYDLEASSLILPEEFTPGENVITVKAYDAAGNASETAAVTFEVSDSSDTENPVIGEETYTPDKILTGVECNIHVEASDNSGDVQLTLTIGDETLEYDAMTDSYKYLPDTSGEVKLLVYAEDAAGNHAEKEVVLTVYKNTEAHKLKVDAPNIVKTSDEINVTLSSTDGVPFDEAELWLGNQDLSQSLTHNEDGTFSISFTLGQTGTADFKAVGRDSDGYEDTVEFTIQVSADFNTEINSEEMQASLAQTSETQLSDELKALAGSFSSPADAYEYVYNNIAFESYVNSRRGAIGAYELKRGNDYDQASLLIGLLREMGYPARYAQGTAILTDEQTMSLMAMEDFKSATDMLASSGKKAGILTDESGQQFVRLKETYVQVYVPGSEIGETDDVKKNLGVWVELDTSIKESVLTEVSLAEDSTNLSGELSSLYAEYADTEIKDFTQKMDGVYSKKTTAYIRDIVQSKFDRLPSELQYSLYSDDTMVNTYNEIPMEMADTVEFVISNGVSGKNLGTYKISELYGKRVTLQYVGNTGGGTIFDMNKNAIYDNAFLPALTIDGEIVSEYTYSELCSALSEYYIEPETEYFLLKNQSWRLGEKNTLLTRITTGGKSEDITDDLIIGNTYALSFDTGGITESQINKAIDDAARCNGIDNSNASNPVFDKGSPDFPTSASYYDEDKIGSFLDFAGKYYFLMCDAYGTINANLSNVESSNYTKMVITSYNVGVYEDTIMGYSTTDIVPGRFEIDVAYNTSYSFSRTGDTEERNYCLFNTAYMESYYEGWIWEALLFQSGVSTVSIISDAIELGGNLLFIDSSNIEEMLVKADVTSEEESEIRKEASEGRVIIIPDKRICVDEWSGTGYIVADLENYNNFIFKVSGGINGGSGTTTVDLKDVKELTSEAMEKTFEASFVICQSMYYYLLETTMCSKVMPAAEACVSACQSGSTAAIAATGIKLYNEVSGLAGVLEFRVKLLDNLYEYCCGDQFKATANILTLLVDMMKKTFKMTANDARKSFYLALGIPENEIEQDKFVRNILKLIDKYLDTNFYQEDWIDKATKTPSFA